MSLVSDALKKAQREAAQREAKAKGLPEPLVAASQPYRARRTRLARPLFRTLGVLALLVVGSLVTYRLARSPAGPEGAAPSAAAPPPAAALDLARSRAERAPEQGPVGSASTSASRDLPPPVAEPRSTAARELSGATSAPAPPAPKAQSEERVFVREAVLDDGAEIRLGGIAWSEVAPLAYLNGRLAGVGESVSGWKIEAIGRDRVRLAGPDGRIVIALR